MKELMGISFLNDMQSAHNCIKISNIYSMHVKNKKRSVDSNIFSFWLHAKITMWSLEEKIRTLMYEIQRTLKNS